MTELPILGAILFASVLGVRHGLDWDHLTAIADLVGVPGQHTRRSLGLALWYCLGHGTVILVLGLLVGVLGLHLPPELDRVSEMVVGATLVLMGLLVLGQVWRQGSGYQFAGRWSTLLHAFERLRRHGRPHVQRPLTGQVSLRAAMGVGVLHGSGAETPSQVVLFATAAAAGSSDAAALVLLAFVVGLIASDLAVALVWLSGRVGTLRVPGGQLALGLLTSISSLVVGLLFLFERSEILPVLFGG
jgi:high-affinity nickel-transport protein